MAEMASFWAFQENQDMEQLGQKLLYTTLELEKLKSEAIEEMTKNKEYIKQLILLLKHAINERDQARNQLQKLLHNKNTLSPHFQHDFKRTTNSSVTESNSLNSSPVESLFDAVSSPEFNPRVNHPLVQDFDHGSFVIDSLVKGRVLPEKGKFLQAVLQAGPLLQTLLVAGPLPTWRNPPQMQPFQIPPVSINGCDKVGSSVLNFGGFGYGTNCVISSVSLGLNGVNGNGFVPLAKRQRLS